LGEGDVKAFRHDLFVSYAASSNDLPAPCDKWVSRFVDGLGRALRARLDGVRPSIYFDERTIEPNDTIEGLLDEVESSRLFIAISSSAYNSRPWPRREIEAFQKTYPDPSRLFVVAAEPVESDRMLAAIRARHRALFHEPFEQGSNRIPMPLAPDNKRFFEGIWDLAVSIANRLRALRELEDGGAPAPPFRIASLPLNQSPVAAPAQARANPVVVGPTILLAQVTEDLDPDLLALRRALEQIPSLRVLPNDDFPQSGSNFKESFRANLESADFVVQLLSSVKGRTSADFPDGYVRFQADSALQSGVKLMQWRRADLVLANVADAGHRALLQLPTVTASTLPAFIADVIGKVSAPPAQPSQAVPNDRYVVFVGADMVDLDAARVCGQKLADKCDIILPPQDDEGHGPSVQEELNTVLAECDAMLFVSGESGSRWVRGQLTQALKIRSVKKRPIVGAVLHGPPNGKRPINMLIRGIEEIDCTGEDGRTWSFSDVERLVAKVQGS
jgi:hypothetical protein